MQVRLALLVLYQFFTAKHMTRQNLKHLRYSALCGLHVALYAAGSFLWPHWIPPTPPNAPQ